MKQVLHHLFVALLLIGTSCTQAVPANSSAIESAHKASYQIGQATLQGQSFCSATAIGPQALLSATHCELPDEILYIRGVDADVTIVGRIRDGFDHTIFLVEGTTFSNYAPVDLSPISQAQEVFTFGNPGDWLDIYQRGYVAGVQKDQSLGAALGHGEPDQILFSMQAYPGESGAGIFNTSGAVVAVLGFVAAKKHGDTQISMTGAFPLGFAKEDIDKARAFTTPPPAKEKK